MANGLLGKYYPAYHCSHHGHYFRVPKDEFDGKINAFVARITVNPERYEEVIQAVLTVWEQRQVRAQDEGAMRTKKREELEAEARVIVDKMRLVSSPTAIKYMEEDLTNIEQRINDLDTHKDEQITEGGVDMPIILTYVKYFVEHLKDLLIDHCNPIMRARYFGVIFDQVPSYAEIACGTPEIAKIPGVNELFKLTDPGIIDLVRERGLEPPRSEEH